MRISTIFLIIILAIVSNNASSSEIIPIAPDFSSKYLKNDIFYFIDKENRFIFDSVSNDYFSENFIQLEEQIPHLQHLKGTVWIKFTLENQTNTTKELLIHFDFPLNDTIIFFNKKKISLTTDTIGFAIPFYKRKNKEKDPVFSVILEAQEKQTIYFKIVNTGVECLIPIYVYDESAFYKKLYNLNFAYGIFYGILILIIIINLFFYINLRNRSYLYYILYVISLTVFIMIQDGAAFKYLWPNCIWCAKQSVYQFAIFSIIFIILFAQSSLKSSFYFPKTNRVITITIVVNILFSVSNFFLSTPIYIINNYLTLISSIPVLILSIQVLKVKKLTIGKYFFISFLVLVIGVSFYIMKNFGVVSFTTGEVVLKIAFIIQILILLYGLIAMYQTIQKDTNQSVVNNLKKLNQMKDKLNESLENEVKFRTIELDRKNEELLLANKQLGAERDIFEMQRNLISIQKQHTTDSIMYAKRIQSTLMQSQDKLESTFPKSILIDLPKDIVSGDFFWVHETESTKYAAVADGTGHGVPGAFMSIIGITYLNEILRTRPDLHTNEILDELRHKLINSFNNNEENNEIKDGLDISLIAIKKESNILEFSGAYNSAYVVRGNELITLKADRMPISSHEKQTQPFTLRRFNTIENDTIYLFTDGYVDQFGWRSGKKFKHKQFKELLLDINEMPSEVKQVVLKNSLKNWMGDLEQVDDIMILGIKI